MEFKDILRNRNKELQGCEEAIQHIKYCFSDHGKYESNSYVLINLLQNKIGLFNRLKHDNYDEISSKLEALNEQIYMQINILEKDVADDFKSIDSKSSRYNIENIKEKLNYDKKEIPKEWRQYIINQKYLKDFLDGFEGKRFNNFIFGSLKDIFLNFKNVSFVVLISCIVGLIPFALYFFIQLKYVPVMQGLDIFYLTAMVGVAGFIYLSLFLLLPLLYFGIVELSCSDNKDKKHIRIYFIFSTIIISVILFLTTYCFGDNQGKFNHIAIAIIILMPLVAIFIYYLWLEEKCISIKVYLHDNKDFIFNLFIFIILGVFILLLAFIINISMLYLAIHDVINTIMIV
ncbi:MAG: hypothetical protein GX282_01790, partial [Campylobacteraceae bacterium]|nr:hypothetical protein [Campylobacteraceae bacterium]